MYLQRWDDVSSSGQEALSRRRLLKRSGGVLGALSLSSAFPLAACSSDRESGGKSDARGKTTLAWSMWSGGSDEQQAWQKVATTVHKKHSDIHLDLQTSAFEDYFTRLGTRIAGDEAPCLVSMQSLRLGTFAETMQPLDDLISRSRIDLSEFDSNSLKALKSDGKQVALPYDNGPILILYNKDMFKKAGIAEPDADWTVKDFERIAKKLTRNRKYGYKAHPNGQEMLSMLVTYNGAKSVSHNGKLQLNSPAMVDAFSWYTGLVRDKHVAPEISGVTDDSTDQFIAGNVAMVPTGPWDILSVNSQADFKVGIARLPRGRHGSKTLSAGSGFGISRSCHVPEKAFEALQVLTGPKVLSFLADEGRAFPARAGAQDAWYRSAPAGSKDALNSALKTARPMLTTANWNDIEEGISQYGGQAFNGENTPGEVLRQLQHEFEAEQ